MSSTCLGLHIQGLLGLARRSIGDLLSCASIRMAEALAVLQAAVPETSAAKVARVSCTLLGRPV